MKYITLTIDEAERLIEMARRDYDMGPFEAQLPARIEERVRDARRSAHGKCEPPEIVGTSRPVRHAEPPSKWLALLAMASLFWVGFGLGVWL